MTIKPSNELNVEQVLRDIYPRIDFVVSSMIKTLRLQQCDRDDLLQDFRQSVITALDKYSPELGTIKTFLYKVIDNRRKDICKHHMANIWSYCYTPINLTDCKDATDECLCPDEQAKDESLRADIQTILGMLTDVEKQVCRLIMENYSYVQIAAILGVSRNHLMRNIMPSIKNTFHKFF